MLLLVTVETERDKNLTAPIGSYHRSMIVSLVGLAKQFNKDIIESDMSYNSSR